MKVAVLGSGVVGVTTAWWLRQAGHDVLVVDRNPGPGQETSRAGGAQLSVSYAEPWATREAPLQVLRSLFHDNAPMRFRPRADWRQWWWGLAYLRQCWPDRLEPNVRAMVQLSAYSLMLLRQLREELGIDYQQRRNGVLNFYRDATDLERSQDLAQILRNLGVDRRVVSVEEMVELEPALAPFAQRLAGGDYTADDESGDGWLFTRALAGHARDAGVRFLFSHTVTRLIADEGRIRAAELVGPDGLYGDVRADAFVVAAGVHAPALLRPLGLSCNVYPVKGYSLTFPVMDTVAAPVTSLTDHTHKVVYSRLGDRLRMSGMVELAGYARGLDTHRCAVMKRQARELFPSALDFDNVSIWAGLRPSTPSGIPLVGRSRIANLYLNTGHGASGWTMAAGSGRAIADIVSGRNPEPEFPFLG